MENKLSEEYRRLLESDSVTDATRRVLLDRIDAVETPPRFFSQAEFEILKTVCDALAPSQIVPHWFAAGEIDKRLAKDSGNGWRYDEMPSDGESYQIALNLFDKSARENYQKEYAALETESRREILANLKKSPANDSKFNSAKFLEELCSEFAEIFYSHPLALEEIGYIGFADKKGWDLGDSNSRFQIPDSKFQISDLEF